ncbi:ATP-binding cassette domain-containing protein [Kitasatospora sp. NBC_01287]|uniref:ABC transporter ATP-binding protein n=1 Tax=Kitasatospora sp. NBC_01287 TaxID=2903573 RepID=UPI002254BB34|nr:ATP-binding cassette domain-containing protein [Kitasatospora sp. NBC_01287]MCX4747149.1 ATP-binding cassette domain-containing protein [Kitasatospora sp. NBC_01287]
MELLRLTAVGKRYGRSGPWVLGEVELTLGPGELVRIEGANGSGKSTLLKLVAGIEPPSRGTVRTAGRKAYVPERFPPALPFDPAGYLRHLGRIHGLSAASAAGRAEYWLDRFGIADRAGTPLSRLSKGTCQKVAVAQALLAEAEVLLLDEAWTGLDHAARATLDEVAVERAAAGGAVLFVDHGPPAAGGGHRHRLAGRTTRTFRIGAGALTEVEGLPAEAGGLLAGAGQPSAGIERPSVGDQRQAAGGPRPLMGIRVAAGELPDLLPGAPEREEGADGTVLLRVGAERSDDLLRLLLNGPAPVHVLAVGTLEEAR